MNVKKDESELMEEFCKKIGCHTCDGTGDDGDPNGYGCSAAE